MNPLAIDLQVIGMPRLLKIFVVSYKNYVKSTDVDIKMPLNARTEYNDSKVPNIAVAMPVSHGQSIIW